MRVCITHVGTYDTILYICVYAICHMNACLLHYISCTFSVVNKDMHVLRIIDSVVNMIIYSYNIAGLRSLTPALLCRLLLC